MYRIKEDSTSELEIKKSRFITYLHRTNSEEEAKAFVQSIKKLHPNATHHCYAFLIGEQSEIRRSNDDGEPAGTAGVPMLECLDHHQMQDITAQEGIRDRHPHVLLHGRRPAPGHAEGPCGAAEEDVRVPTGRCRQEGPQGCGHVEHHLRVLGRAACVGPHREGRARQERPGLAPHRPGGVRHDPGQPGHREGAGRTENPLTDRPITLA